MTVCLIGAHRTWDGQPLSPTQRDRFAAALGLTAPRPAETSYDGGTLLASTGKRRGWRPQTGPDGSRILFTGHIDNRRQLAEDLGLAAASDEALYAAGYAAWGDAIDLRAIGQFATILVAPDGDDVRLSRSPIAAPPLLYRHDRDRFIVVSFPNAIFATGEVERRLDYERLADGLFRNGKPGTRSSFAGVSKVPCGHRAIAGKTGVALTAYYDLSALPQIRMKDDRDYQVAASELLEAGVKAALDGFSHPAISLSGGLDSQAAAALAARLRPGQPIEAFTCVPEAGWIDVEEPGFFNDERPHVEALIAMYPEIKPHWIDAAHLKLDHKRAAIFLAAGDVGPALLGHFTHDVYAQAQASNCDVMLEMVSGNYTFSFAGEGALPGMLRRGEWGRLWREARHLSQSQPHSAMRIIANQALFPLAPEWIHSGLARLLRRSDLLGIDPFSTWCTLDRDYAARMGVEERAPSNARNNRSRLPTCSRELRIDSLGQDFEDCAESIQAFGLLYGIESRDPTNYRPLVEFCLGIPDDQYLRNGQSRWLARRMLNGLVPDMVVSETRRGARAPDWHQRLGRQRGELIAEFDELLEDESIAAMIDLKSLRQALIDWPEETPPLYQHERHMFAVLDGLNTAQFIRFAEGRNR